MTPGRAWLGEVSSVVLQQALADLNAGYRNFFASVTGKRTGPKVAPPRFRCRTDRRQAVRFTANTRFRVLASGCLRLPKIGDVEVRWSRDLPSAPSSVTVIRDAAGRYFASFVVEAGGEPFPGADAEVGIDLGADPFRCPVRRPEGGQPEVLAPGRAEAPQAPEVPEPQGQGSANREKTRVRVARQHVKVTDSRRDFHHKESTRIVRESQAVYVDDLCVAGLGRTRLAKSVHDAGWSAFTAMLEYKSARHGRVFAKTGRFEPTSQVCSACGVKDGPKPLNVRVWACPACGAVLDRDVNAAVNIRKLGQVAAGHAETLNSRGGQVRPGPVPAPASETGTRPKSRRKAA